MNGVDFNQAGRELDKGQVYSNIRNTGWHAGAVYEKFSAAEFQRRYELTRAAMARRGLDCLIVPGSIHAMSMGQGMVWLTGHLDIRTMAHYVLFPRQGEPTLFCSMGGSHAEAVRQAVAIKDVRSAPGNDFGSVLAARLKELGHEGSTIGLMNVMSENFGVEYLPVNHYLTLKEALPDATLEFVPEFFHELMVLHSDEEMLFIRKAGELCDRALEAMAAQAKPGVTESQLAGSAAKAIMDGGGIPHLLIVAITSMEAPDAPFGNPRPSGKALSEGDIILNEIGAWYQGVSAQIGNPIVFGEPTGFARDFYYEVAVPGFERMAEKLAPGMTLDDVHKAGAMYFREKGHQSRALHLHGIDVVTAGPAMGPYFVRHKDYDYVLQPGMEIMLEPCPITADGKLGMFLGRTFLITTGGQERVTQYPLELTVVRPRQTGHV